MIQTASELASKLEHLVDNPKLPPWRIVTVERVDGHIPSKALRPRDEPTIVVSVEDLGNGRVIGDIIAIYPDWIEDQHGRLELGKAGLRPSTGGATYRHGTYKRTSYRVRL